MMAKYTKEELEAELLRRVGGDAVTADEARSAEEAPPRTATEFMNDQGFGPEHVPLSEGIQSMLSGATLGAVPEGDLPEGLQGATKLVGAAASLPFAARGLAKATQAALKRGAGRVPAMAQKPRVRVRGGQVLDEPAAAAATKGGRFRAAMGRAGTGALVGGEVGAVVGAGDAMLEGRPPLMGAVKGALGGAQIGGVAGLGAPILAKPLASAGGRLAAATSTAAEKAKWTAAIKKALGRSIEEGGKSQLSRRLISERVADMTGSRRAAMYTYNALAPSSRAQIRGYVEKLLGRKLK
jgi:hypothetical protein